MSQPLPMVYLARHGETAWSITGQHTGRTDLPLTERGERAARSLGERLRGLTFAGVFTRVRAFNANVLLFSSGHILRVVGARWLGLEPAGGRLFFLATASLSTLGYEKDLNEPVFRLWNDVSHVRD